MKRRMLAACFGGWVLLTCASPSLAHDLPRERTMLVQITPDRLEAMIVYQEPPGKRVDWVKGKYDLDGNGEIDGGEAEAAAPEWIPYALQGLEVEAGDTELERTSGDVKFRNEHSGALSSAVYLEWAWPDLEAGDTRTVEVHRASDGGSFQTLVRFQTSAPLHFTDSPGDDSTPETGRIGPFELTPGQSLEVSVEGTDAKAAHVVDTNDSSSSEADKATSSSPPDDSERSADGPDTSP